MAPKLTVRLWPTSGTITLDHLAPLIARAAPTIGRIPWARRSLQLAGAEGEGQLLEVELADDDPDAMIRDIRQALGIAKWFAVQRPDWWVEVWDDLGVVEATFDGLLSLVEGHVVVRDTGERDVARETKLADHVAKVWLVGLDLGLPPHIPDEVVAAAESGVPEALRTDERFARTALAAIDRCGKLRRDDAAERLAAVLDALPAELVRPLVVEGFADHAHAARRRLGGWLAAMEPTEAVDLGIDVLFAVPKGTALDDAAAALLPFVEDPVLLATLGGVVDEVVPPGPGSRVDGACADLLLRTREGALAVARRARRDRPAEPNSWWAVRKLVEHPREDVLPTVLLYARPGAMLPGWLEAALVALDDPRRPAGGRLSEEDVALLVDREDALLGPPT